MPPVGFEPTISAGERPQTHALDRGATGRGISSVTLYHHHHHHHSSSDKSNHHHFILLRNCIADRTSSSTDCDQLITIMLPSVFDVKFASLTTYFFSARLYRPFPLDFVPTVYYHSQNLLPDVIRSQFFVCRLCYSFYVPVVSLAYGNIASIGTKLTELLYI